MRVERLLGLAVGALLMMAALGCAAPTSGGGASAPASAAQPAASNAAPVTATAAPASAAPAAAPSAGAYRPTPLQPPVAVRMVEVPGAFNAGIYLAHQRGYFREE